MLVVVVMMAVYTDVGVLIWQVVARVDVFVRVIDRVEVREGGRRGRRRGQYRRGGACVVERLVRRVQCIIVNHEMGIVVC